MRLKNIFVALLATLVLFGCQKEQFKVHLDEVQVSSSYIGIPKAGGQVNITVTANNSWTINGIPSWLTVSPASGSAGETTVTFKAISTVNNNKVTLNLQCGDGVQIINVVQGVEPPPVSPIKEITAEGTIYRAEGTVTGIYNTQYGNWYLVDEAGDQILIYGTLDAKGAEKNFASLGIEDGDKVIVEGPLTIYNGTPELVNVTVIKHIKTLVKVISDPVVLPKEGGDFSVDLECKGNGVAIEIPEEAKSWLSVTGIQKVFDSRTEKEKTVVSFYAAKNEVGIRSIDIVFTTKNTDSKDTMVYSATTKLVQEGNLEGKGTMNEPYTIKDVKMIFDAGAQTSDSVYVAGYITSIEEISTQYGNAGYYIADSKGGSNAILVYRGYYLDGAKFTNQDQIKAGATVLIKGVIGQYNGVVQITNSSIVTYTAPDEAPKGSIENPYTAAEAKAAAAKLSADETSNEVYVKGIITYIKEYSTQSKLKDYLY